MYFKVVLKNSKVYYMYKECNMQNRPHHCHIKTILL